MINLSTLNQILDATEQQQMQESSLAQKAAESAATPQEYKLSPEAQSIVDEVQKGRERDEIRRRLMVYNDAMMQDSVNRFAGGSSIHIDPSKKGTFTAAASRHGMGVQEFASRVLAHKENYSPAMVKKANFARNASKFHHAFGGPIEYANGGYIEDGLRRLGVTGFRVTSGYRGPNSKVGHAGKRSGHARTLKDGSSGAIDIVPTSKTASGWTNLEAQLRSPAVQNFLAGFGGTILDERDPATMRKTGATGPHFHVGLGVRGGGNFYGHNHDHAVSMQDSTGMGGYFAMPQTSESLAVFGNEPQQDSFIPWWQVGQTDENFLAQQAAGAAGGAYDMSQFQPSWIEPVENSGTFPQLFANGGCIFPYVRTFADGGPYSDDFMDYYGYSWVPANQIYPSDPYFRQIQEHNPNGTYAVDSNGYYVPASIMKKEWDFYNSAPSMNNPATAIPLPEVEYTMHDDDISAVDAANRMFGDNRRLVYDDLWNRGSSSATNILNKLDTLATNSAYMGLNTNPERVAKLKEKKYHLMSDGSLRAQYNTNTNVATIEPIAGRFFDTYLDEFTHSYQHNSAIPGLNLVGYNPRAISKDRSFVDGSYNDPESDEYKAHRWLEPAIKQYLNNPSMTYVQFIDAVRSSQPGNITKR